MKIVIDIPEEVKNKIDENLNACDLDIYDCVMVATKHGTPLPKHHGRLIDADKIMRVDHIVLESAIDNAPTIIEADKEEENEVDS